MSTKWWAWYSPKHPDGTWDLAYSTRLVVISWQAVAVSGGAGVEVEGFVMNPANVGTSGGLVPADSFQVIGSDGRPQSFVTYVAEDHDEACAGFESYLT